MRIDSNSIQLPFEAINHIDTTYLTHQTQVKNNQVIKDIYSINSGDLPVGLGGISIDNKRQVVSISGSAKLLGENYLEGIHKNTFAQYIDTINQLGIIELDVYKTFELGIYHKIDTTNNIDMGLVYDLNSQWSDILGYLCIAKMNERFDIDEYDRKHNQGITYIGDQQEKNRLIMYRKHTDLSRSKDKKGISNKQFFATIKNPVKFLESTKDILRVEQNLTSFRAIRERLNVDSTSIQNILQNGINPNPYMLDKITQPHRQNQLLMLFNEYNPETHKIQDIIELEGMKNIIRQFNYCDKTIKKLIKRYTSQHMFRYYWSGGKKSITPFRPLIDELKSKDSNKDPQVNQVVEYIRQSMLSDKVA